MFPHARNRKHAVKAFAGAVLSTLAIAPLALPLPARAATLSLSQTPLTQPDSGGAVAPIKPNLFFILDDSGSMQQHYTPDYLSDFPGYPDTGRSAGSSNAAENQCFDSGDDTNSDYDRCEVGDPPFMTPNMNFQYYNPNIVYLPGKNADGTDMPSMTAAQTSNWTAVPIDPYGVWNRDMLGNSPTSKTTDLISGFPDRVWCNDRDATPTDTVNCKRNSAYIYPDSVYQYGRATNAAYKYVFGAPYWYEIGVGEYCDSDELTNCVVANAPTGAFVFPAKVRWCSNADHQTGCQARNNPQTGHIYVKYSGTTAGAFAWAKIDIDSSGNDDSVSLTGVTVNGVSIIGTTITAGGGTNSTGERAAVATALANAINSFDSAPQYSACAGSTTGCNFPDGTDVPSDQVMIWPSTDDTTRTPLSDPAFNGLPVSAISPQIGTAVSRAQIDFNTVNSGSTVTSITIDGVEVLNSTLVGSGGNATARRRSMTKEVCDAINSHFNGAPWEYVAGTSLGSTTCSNTSTTLYVQAPIAEGSNPNGLSVVITKSGTLSYDINNGASNSSGSMTGGAFATMPVTTTNMGGGLGASNTFSRIDLVPAGFPRAAPAGRTDCALLPGQCTYDEEMTNFANWYAYYRHRMNMMKTASGRSFASVTSNFRVGFTTINNTSTTRYLKVSDFDNVQKSNWFTKFYEQTPNGSTPLRHALSRAGRFFAGKNPYGAGDDPVQYSCQQNFALLTTDGLWNEDWDSGIAKVNGTQMGNEDGASSTPRPFYDGGLGGTCGPGSNNSVTSSCGTLADVAFHYYETDLRTSALANCTGTLVGTQTFDVCENRVRGSGDDNATHQHMTTFTLGLGVDGTLRFRDDYKFAGTGDYAEIVAGSRNWPSVKNNTATTVDDLWHAAVNGRGQYFSARDPATLTTGLNAALAGIKIRRGAGAAAATSNLEPILGDNFSYVASYSTAIWTGNLEAREINVSTGQTKSQALWCVEDVAANASTGATACTGTLKAKVAAFSDTRNIYTYDGGAANFLRSFAWGTLSAGERAFFDPTSLSQFSGLTAGDQAAATGEALVNYLRGQFGLDGRSTNTNRPFRLRVATMGDVVGSQPVFVGPSGFEYTDAGYSTFKGTVAGRGRTVYIGGNDGMLHAFDAVTGEERWAYIPTAVLPFLKELADTAYTSQHRFFTDGSPGVSDVCVANCGTVSAEWRTILVGGFNAGGQGYYALDVTDPTAPKALWEFGTAQDPDAGNSYGNPLVTKKSDGTWVVLVTSGYNNVGTGQGYLFVLDAATGVVISKISTGVGTAITPSGLGRINAYVEDATKNNTAEVVYGGDLEGNVWRFDINAGTVVKVATLLDPSGASQPITVRPEVTKLDNSSTRIVLLGTGKLLELGDLTDPQVQTIYGIYDVADTLGRPVGTCALCVNGARDEMQEQTLSAIDTTNLDPQGRATRTLTSNGVIGTKYGWFVDLPESGERVNVDVKLTAGVLTVASNLPKDDACVTGGDSFITNMDYATGGQIGSYASVRLAGAFTVGLVILKLAGGYVVTATKSDDPTPELVGSVPPNNPDAVFQGKRVTWRELID